MVLENKGQAFAAIGISSLVAVSVLVIGFSYFPSEQTLQAKSTTQGSSFVLTTASSSSTTETGASPAPEAVTCSAMSTRPSTSASPFIVMINYTGHWNADISGYSGSTQAFAQCYNGEGVGYMSLSSWNPNGSESLSVMAQKLGGDNGTLVVVVNKSVNSTSTPYGSVIVLGEVQP